MVRHRSHRYVRCRAFDAGNLFSERKWSATMSVLATGAGAGERSEESPHFAYQDLFSGLIFALYSWPNKAAWGWSPTIAYYLIFNWRRAIRLTLSFGLSITILYGIFWLTSAGWINYYYSPSRRACLRFQHWQNHQRADQSIRAHSYFSN